MSRLRSRGIARRATVDTVTRVTNTTDDRLAYRLLTGPDTSAFCQRVSDALADGYVLHGSPAITFDGTTTYVAQAVVLPSALADGGDE